MPSRRAAGEGKLNEKANRRFDAVSLATLSRIFAREAALKVAEQGLRWIIGATAMSDAELVAFEKSLGVAAIHGAQVGLIADMDSVADALYGRVARAVARAA